MIALEVKAGTKAAFWNPSVALHLVWFGVNENLMMSSVGRAQWGNLWFSLIHPHWNTLMTVRKWQISKVESSSMLQGRAESTEHHIKAFFQPYSQAEELELGKGSGMQLFFKYSRNWIFIAFLHDVINSITKLELNHQWWLLSSPCRNVHYLQHCITPGKGQEHS